MSRSRALFVAASLQANLRPPFIDIPKSFDISPIGYVHSTLKERSDAPRQGWEGAPNARLEILPPFIQGLDGIKAGEDIWIFTWLH